MKAGDFTGLAQAYSRNRPDYSHDVLDQLIQYVGKPMTQVQFADVGAGTGIWTRMVYDRGPRKTVAVEPNADMRQAGQNDSSETEIEWYAGSAEKTGLESEGYDWVTMASSFHWANFELATKEFHRILRKGGVFTALWNPRLIELNPLLVEIENYLSELKGDIVRVSSGRSGVTETLLEKLSALEKFSDVSYMEGTHVIRMDPERYLGVWKSVNDLQVQLGKEKFEKFLSFVENKIASYHFVEATYLTRAWSVRKR